MLAMEITHPNKAKFEYLACYPVLLQERKYITLSFIIFMLPVLAMALLTIFLRCTVRNANKRARRQRKAVRKPLVILLAVLVLEGLTLLPYTAQVLLKPKGWQRDDILYYAGVYCLGLNLCGHSATFLVANKDLRRYIARGFRG